MSIREHNEKILHIVKEITAIEKELNEAVDRLLEALDLTRRGVCGEKDSRVDN